MNKKFFLASFFLLFIFSGCLSMRGSGSVPITQETHFVDTEDDWTLELKRFFIPGGIEYSNPIILCHGLGYNGRFWDIEEDKSFAAYLADKGFDVWVVSLRGAGKSTKAGWLAFRDIIGFRTDDFSNLSFSADKLDWNIDDHINEDVPSVIKKVKEITGKKKVDWVGQSMGSLIALAYLGSAELPEEIGNIVAISPACVMFKPQNESLEFIKENRYFVDATLIINQKTLYKFLVPFRGLIKDPFANLFINSENMDSSTFVHIYNEVVESVSPGVVNQFIQQMDDEYFYSSDKKINYTENLVNVTNPILFVAGRDDNLVSPESVRYGYRAVGSKDKTYIELSKINGAEVDYGHDDIIIGKNVSKEVYPKIYYWLKSRNSK